MLLEEVALAANSNGRSVANKKIDLVNALRLEQPQMDMVKCLHRYTVRFKFGSYDNFAVNALKMFTASGTNAPRNEFLGEEGAVIIAIIYATAVKQNHRITRAKICKICKVGAHVLAQKSKAIELKKKFFA